MGLLRSLANEIAYAKIGLYGFAGSGKTFTSSKMAIGLAKFIKADTVAFFDTETGSNYVKHMFDEAGIKLMGVKSRLFKDAVSIIKECEDAGIKVLIVDSISHVWRELCDAYMEKKKRTRLKFQDWTYLKGEWRKFTDAYLGSQVHIILAGRAGYEYNMSEDEDGNKELETTGVKMKAETEMGYEPSLLIFMDRQKVADISVGSITQEFKRVAHVQKDRFDIIDGQQFDNPGFDVILPHVGRLNLNGEHILPDPEASSADVLKDQDWSYEEKKKRKDRALGEIKATFDKYFGASAADKKAKIAISEQVFDCKSWAAVEQLPFDRLEAAVYGLEGKTSILEDQCIEAGKAEKGGK